MMDESPLGVLKLGNSIEDRDEETDYATTKHDWHKLIDGKQSTENSHVVEAISFKKEVKKLDPIVFPRPGADIKPRIFLTSTNKVLSPAEERHVHYTLPPPLYFKPFIRKKVRQEEIVFNRECKKVEKVWTNRGLPVDRETLCSAASKDTFDLKDLSDSLPSTSTSVVNKPIIVETETGCQARPSMTAVECDKVYRRLAAKYLPNKERIENYVYSTISARHFALNCEDIVSETIPSACNSQMEQRDKLMSLVMAQRLIHLRRHANYKKKFHPLLYLKKPDCDEQKEASEDSLRSRLKKALSNFKHTRQELSQNPHSNTSEEPNFGAEFAKMSIDDKQDEKKKETQDSDEENHMLSPELNHVPLMTTDVPKLEMASSWNSSKHWNTKFDWVPKELAQIEQDFYQLNPEDPPAFVPFNSPIKKEENTGKKDIIWYMGKEVANGRLNALKHLREQNKLKTLNSFRKIVPGVEDSSESEKPALEEVSRIFYQKVPKVDSSTQTMKRLCIDTLKEHVKEHRRIFREMKESFKNVRTIYDPFARRRIVKSDKVVPD